MINDQLNNFIKESRQKGVPDNEIRQQLLGAGGWTTEDIQEAFNKVDGIIKSTISSGVSSKKYIKLGSVLFSIVFLIVGGYFALSIFGLVPNFKTIKNTDLLAEESTNQEIDTIDSNISTNSNSLQIDEEPIVNSSQTSSGWSIYENTLFNFQFKYPPKFKTEERRLAPGLFMVGFSYNNNDGGVISVITTDNRVSSFDQMESWLDENDIFRKDFYDDVTIKNIEINNRPTLHILVKEKVDNDDAQIVEKFFLFKDGLIYEIMIGYTDLKLSPDLQKIAHSFEFLN